MARQRLPPLRRLPACAPCPVAKPFRLSRPRSVFTVLASPPLPTSPLHSPLPFPPLLATCSPTSELLSRQPSIPFPAPPPPPPRACLRGLGSMFALASEGCFNMHRKALISRAGIPVSFFSRSLSLMCSYRLGQGALAPWQEETIEGRAQVLEVERIKRVGALPWGGGAGDNLSGAPRRVKV